MMNWMVLGLVAGAFAMPALAAEPAPADQHYSKPKKPHMICKREESTGSHMSKPVCKTAAEWADNAAADEATLGTVSRQSTTLDTGGTLSRERPN